MTIESTRRGDRIDWLDYGRFLSAVAVVMYHYLYYGPSTKSVFAPDLGVLSAVSAYGYLGVDFFFIVSGFVIMLSVKDRTPGQFAAARVIRLYPAFLICMTATAIVLKLANRSDMPVSFIQWAVNLTMLPKIVGINNIDGVYWSLYFEIAFYVVVWIAILIGFRRHLERMVLVWLGLQAVSILIYPLPFFSGFFTLFAAGCVFSFARQARWSAVRIIAIIAALLLSLHEVGERAAEMQGFNRQPVVAMAFTLLFFATFAVFHNANPRLPAAKLLGALTYPLYLLHASIGYVLLGQIRGFSYIVSSIIVFIIILLGSYCVAEFVERRYRPFYWRATEIILMRLALRR